MDGFWLEEPNSGSHWKAYAPDGNYYAIPAHNGLKTEIDDGYIRRMCRALGLNEKDFRRKL